MPTVTGLNVMGFEGECKYTPISLHYTKSKLVLFDNNIIFCKNIFPLNRAYTKLYKAYVIRITIHY